MTSQLAALARRLGVGVALVLPLVLGPALVVSAPSAQAATAPSAARVAAYEARVIALINVQRVKYHRAKLAASACPDRYAESWAAYLARTGRFYHQSLTPILRGCRATRVAENLARGNVSEDRIVALWMASPGHRANILDARLTRIGVAAVYARGQWTVAADFSRS
jgi:uncharacterized protein YkwD